MDETGVHDDATVVAVAGYISRPEHWLAWTKDWNRAKRPNKVFHSTDCANFRGEFEGWDKERRDKFMANLLPILPAHELAGVVIGIQLKDLADALNAHPQLQEMIGTPYTACFQWAISIILEIATKYGSSEPIAFVHEVNDYRGEVLKAFEYVNTYLNPRKIPMTMSLGKKSDYPPLQAPDVLAYEGGKFLNNPAGKPRRAWAALDPDKSRLIVRRYSKDSMPTLIALLNSFRAKLLAEGWDGKIVP